MQLTGEPLVQRSDDNPEALKKRLDAYHKQTQPLVDYYSKRSLHVSVDASKSPDAIFKAIVSLFDEIKIQQLDGGVPSAARKAAARRA
jgi:adenylate kinase